MGHSEHELGWPSVTQVIGVPSKPYLYRWYAKNGWEECERIKNAAGEFGSSIHNAIEQVLRNEPYEVSGRQEQLIHKFIMWKDQSGFQPVKIELKVESKTHQYHGTLDAIGHFGNPEELFVMDWKTSSKIDDLYGCQLAAYAAAYYEETGFKINNGGIVRLEKKEDAPKQLEVKTFNNLDEYFETFKACLQVYKFLHPKKRGR